MSARILDGKSLAAQMTSETATAVAEFVQRTGVQPRLAAVLVGDDPASAVYVRNKQRACQRAGIASDLHRLAPAAAPSQLLDLVGRLNDDPRLHGILVQLPLPPSHDTTRVLDAVNPWKDVDAFHPQNVGLLVQGRPRFLPCTPHGVVQLLHRNHITVDGQHVVVVGRSEIVGKPLALMLMQRQSSVGAGAANATVTVCHRRTRDLAAVTRQADVLVAALGAPHFVTADMVSPGATVIDVGINRTPHGLVGDVDFASVQRVAGALTPVPGGVGPMTIAMLLSNTLHAARLQTASGERAASG